MNKIIIWTLSLLMTVVPLQNCNAFFSRAHVKASAFFKYTSQAFKTNRFTRYFSASIHSYPPTPVEKHSFSRGFDDWEKYAHEEDNRMPCPRWIKLSAVFGLFYSFDEIAQRYAKRDNQSKKSH